MVSDSLKLVNDFGVICNSSLVRKVQVTLFSEIASYDSDPYTGAASTVPAYVISNHSAPHDDLPALNATLGQYSFILKTSHNGALRDCGLWRQSE